VGLITPHCKKFLLLRNFSKLLGYLKKGMGIISDCAILSAVRLALKH
jgi:hypothetical protein